MLLFRFTIILIPVVLAIALIIDPALFPNARNARVPIIVGLLLLAGLNAVRLARAWAISTREERLNRVPKKPLGL